VLVTDTVGSTPVFVTSGKLGSVAAEKYCDSIADGIPFDIGDGRAVCGFKLDGETIVVTRSGEDVTVIVSRDWTDDLLSVPIVDAIRSTGFRL
jgi:hypothetical protein